MLGGAEARARGSPARRVLEVSVLRSTSISVDVACRAINAHAITVLPAAGGVTAPRNRHRRNGGKIEHHVHRERSETEPFGSRFDFVPSAQTWSSHCSGPTGLGSPQ
ncbi:hypothetical protein GCM10010464_27820 [Pseudonocardia yunnanensis]